MMLLESLDFSVRKCQQSFQLEFTSGRVQSHLPQQGGLELLDKNCVWGPGATQPFLGFQEFRISLISIYQNISNYLADEICNKFRKLFYI